MEEIIGLLVALAAIIFKVIGNRLEKSGAQDAGNIEVSDEAPQDNPFDARKWIQETVELHEPVEEAPRAVVKPAPKVVAVKTAQKPALKEEAPKVRAKIDPKKLVVYSEIMKPKFKEEN